MARERVPKAVVNRLPGYYRYLGKLEKDGYVRISSQQLGERMGLTASQIRQDINCFGGFGQQGYGYNVSELRSHIGEILGVNQEYHMIAIGAGNIGKAISKYQGFRDMGYHVDVLFDIREDLVGFLKNGLEVKPMSELDDYIRNNPVDIAILAVPESAAQAVCDQLIRDGIHSIWNFAPVDLVVPEGIKLNSVQLADALLVLSYYMNNNDKKAE